MLPVLGALQERYRDQPVVVVGVHSNKFPAEADPDRIRAAMRRYGVGHPVAVDAGRGVWESYTVKAWPTLVFLRPDATIAIALAGEQRLDTLATIVDGLLESARGAFELGARFEPRLEPPPADQALAYPTKVLATPQGLAISDTGHHRVLLLDTQSKRISAIGSGTSGLADGASAQAQLCRPRGLALMGSALFVADTGNHALRCVDLDTLQVHTVAGNGRLGKTVPEDLTSAASVELRSPWDLAVSGGIVFIAMAGTHQIWAYVPEEASIAVFAGSGREAIDDGSFHEASFAQPSGLSVAGNRVYVADSETSSIRVIDLETTTVSTLVGRGLFEFGDVDGPREAARLQHVQDVALGPHGLLVADTYNDKIKQVDAETGYLSTWFVHDGELGLSEPEGLIQLDGGQLVVADTNAHRIVVIDGESKAAKVLNLSEYSRAGQK